MGNVLYVCTILTRGGVKNAGNAKKQNAVKKMIKQYCDDIRKLPNLPIPNGGDCWHCHFVTQDGVPWGDKDKDHFMEHLQERYVHGSLIFNAMKDAGHTDYMIGLAFKQGDCAEPWSRDRAVSAVRRYFKRKLGLA
jgi:hypothetical protein